jgi:poly-gamma-glutamate synthesis protein (capsule biosynthesis protein)
VNPVRRALLAAGAVLALGAPAACASGEATPPAESGAATAPPTTRDPVLGNGESVTFVFGGDSHFEKHLLAGLQTDPEAMLAPAAEVLGAADIAMVNLETAVAEGGTRAPKEFAFRAPPESLTALAGAGVDVVTLANNHGMDYGEDGLGESLAAERDTGVPVVGIGADDTEAYAPWLVEVRGQRIAVLGATQVLDDSLIDAWTAGPGKPGLASAKEEERLLQAVREARAEADTVVVYVHWGTERQDCPTERQTGLAPKLIEAGADVIVGSHAHRLQGAGRLGDAFVAYGLGNFIWWREDGINGESGFLEVTVTGRRIDGYTWIPARIVGGVPTPLEGDPATLALDNWEILRGCTDLTA